MIKINLLPTATKKKAVTLSITVKPTVMLLGALLVFILLGEGITWYWMRSNINSLMMERQNLQLRLKTLRKRVKAVEDYEKNKKSYEKKIAIIQRLKNNQKGPVKILDELSRELPERVWLQSIKENGNILSISGAGITNDDIVRYVKNLKNVEIFKSVRLLESRQAKESGVPVYKFSLSVSVDFSRV